MREKLNIKIPALPRPTFKELQLKWPWIQSIESDTSPITAVPLELDTVLKAGENYINGSEYQSRLEGIKTLGYQQAVWLVEHQDKFPKFKKLLDKIYIDFPAIVLLGGGGSRGFPYLGGGGGRWYLDWRWIGGGLTSSGRVARSGKFLEFRKLKSSPNLEVLDLSGEIIKIKGREYRLEKVK